MVNGKWLPDFIERLKASAWHQLYLPLLPFTHARSESINADRKSYCMIAIPASSLQKNSKKYIKKLSSL